MKIRGLTFIFIIALAITFWINFIDLKLDTFWVFTDKADKLNSIIDNLSLAFIGGYIFYFLNIYLVERNEKKHIMPFIAERINRIIGGNREIIRILKQDINLTDYNIEREEFASLINLERLNKLEVYRFHTITFLNYLEGNRGNTLSTLSRILNSGKHVDDELRIILFRLDEADFLSKFYEIDNKSSYDIFSDYFKDIEKLNIYYDKSLKKYLRTDCI